MAEYIESLQHLAEEFGRLEGVGRKSAMRMAFSVLEFSDEEAAEFAQAVIDAKQKIHLCPICQNLTDRDVCPICADLGRDRSVICVVTDAKTVLAMEKVREFRGVYHVLHGLISPMNGVTPDHLKIKELLERVSEGEVREVIVATNPTVEGEATALYLSKLLKPFDVKVTRLAYGVPVGADLEYADEVTLFRALEGRREV
ncbi:MAG: recombination protein RecR [Clostridia bacterium]|nr:recombination protein RecR [Clostridia bacterium]MBQ3639901.1 recombination protein RecR [Clostridia bacterium]